MSKARELLLECKIKLKIDTDYKLAKTMEIDRARIADYMNEKRVPDAYVAIKIAKCLNKNPIEVLAEIEADTEKNEKRKNFWLEILKEQKEKTEETYNKLILNSLGINQTKS